MLFLLTWAERLVKIDKFPPTCFKFASNLFQNCFKSDSKLLQTCWTNVLQICFKIALRLFQSCFKLVANLLQTCLKHASNVPEGWSSAAERSESAKPPTCVTLAFNLSQDSNYTCLKLTPLTPCFPISSCAGFAAEGLLFQHFWGTCSPERTDFQSVL